MPRAHNYLRPDSVAPKLRAFKLDVVHGIVRLLDRQAVGGGYPEAESGLSKYPLL